MSYTTGNPKTWKGRDNATEACGSNSRVSKLTENQVREIKAQPTLSSNVLGRMYGVSGGAIRKIRKGETWSHVR